MTMIKHHFECIFMKLKIHKWSMRENVDIITHTAPTTQPEDTSHAHSKCAGVQAKLYSEI